MNCICNTITFIINFVEVYNEAGIGFKMPKKNF